MLYAFHLEPQVAKEQNYISTFVNITKHLQLVSTVTFHIQLHRIY